MKFLKHMKDGGPQSRVFGYFLVEIKAAFSVALLHFRDGSREAFHSHAFHAVSWVLKGRVTEHLFDGTVNEYRASWRPVLTRRSTFHKVVSDGDTWVLTFRGPWADRWKEFLPGENRFLTLTHGRRTLSTA